MIINKTTYIITFSFCVGGGGLRNQQAVPLWVSITKRLVNAGKYYKTYTLISILQIGDRAIFLLESYKQK